MDKKHVEKVVEENVPPPITIAKNTHSLNATQSSGGELTTLSKMTSDISKFKKQDLLSLKQIISEDNKPKAVDSLSIQSSIIDATPSNKRRHLRLTSDSHSKTQKQPSRKLSA